MISGNALLRQENATSIEPYGSGLGWMSHGLNVQAVGRPKGFTSCPYGFAAAMTMPFCWNGEDINTGNPSGHMAYPTGNSLADRPAPHNDARFPQILVEYWLNVETFNGLYSANDQPFLLSNGDPTGYSFHVDFVSSYPSLYPSNMVSLWSDELAYTSTDQQLGKGVLNGIMPTCRLESTGDPPLSDDSCFGKHAGTYTSDEMNACTVKPIVDEDVGWNYGKVDNLEGGKFMYGGVLSALPSCNPIQPGPGPAKIVTC